MEGDNSRNDTRRPSSVTIRPVRQDDLPILLEHWTRILSDDSMVARAIELDGRVAGNVGSFEYGGRREVGYWIDRAYWGRGVATLALAAFLDEEIRRPLFAGVAPHNVGSIRVLEKCGFERTGEIGADGHVIFRLG